MNLKRFFRGPLVWIVLAIVAVAVGASLFACSSTTEV